MNAVKGLLNRKDKLISIVIALKKIPALNQEIWQVRNYAIMVVVLP